MNAPEPGSFVSFENRSTARKNAVTRMALGAQRAAIVWLVLRSVLTLEGIGLAIGVPVVLAGSRYVESLLFGIKPNDPGALTAGVAVLLTAGLVASYVPARRASKIDPMAAVRHE